MNMRDVVEPWEENQNLPVMLLNPLIPKRD